MQIFIQIQLALSQCRAIQKLNNFYKGALVITLQGLSVDPTTVFVLTSRTR